MQGYQIEQAVGHGLAIRLGPAFAKRAQRRLGVGQMVGFYALAEGLAVAHHATHRNAAKVHAVIALLTANQAGLAALTLGTPVRAGHLERGVCRFRTRASEEHMLQPSIQTLWHQAHDAIGQLK